MAAWRDGAARQHAAAFMRARAEDAPRRDGRLAAGRAPTNPNGSPNGLHRRRCSRCSRRRRRRVSSARLVRSLHSQLLHHRSLRHRRNPSPSPQAVEEAPPPSAHRRHYQPRRHQPRRHRPPAPLPPAALLPPAAPPPPHAAPLPPPLPSPPLPPAVESLPLPLAPPQAQPLRPQPPPGVDG